MKHRSKNIISTSIKKIKVIEWPLKVAKYSTILAGKTMEFVASLDELKTIVDHAINIFNTKFEKKLNTKKIRYTVNIFFKKKMN